MYMFMYNAHVSTKVVLNVLYNLLPVLIRSINRSISTPWGVYSSIAADLAHRDN